MVRNCQILMFLKAELIGIVDRLHAGCEITKKETRITPRFVAVAVGRMNLSFIEKKYERRSLGRKEQEFGFTNAKFEICTRHLSEYIKKTPG